MTSQTLDSRKRFGRTLGLSLGLGLALLANLGDRAFSASPANGGIDPLEILNTAVKNNVLFFVDTSGSMSATPEDNLTVGGDDPASRFYQMKRAVREVLSDNVGKANFGLATFAPDAREAVMTNTGLYYLSQDPTANFWRTYFNQLDTDFTDHNADTCPGGGGTCVGFAAAAADIFRGLGNNGVYPAVCTAQPAGNQVANSGVPNAPIPHVYGTHCRYYMRSMLMRNGKRYRVNPNIANNTTRRDTAVQLSTNITCPMPPPGLLGDDVLPFADGTRARACFQIQNSTNNVITTFWATSARFNYTNVAAAAGADSCSSNGTVIDVADCGVDNSAAIQANMRMELQYDVNGAAQFLPPVTQITGQKPGITDTPYPLPNPPVRFNNVGIRQAFLTPLAAAMQFSLTYFRNTVLAAGGTGQRPVVAQGKQKNFVILLSDGDESCGGDPIQAAYDLWNNTLPALPACDAACLTAKGITAREWAVANRIELLMITFAGGTPATVNNISRAGTGRNPANGVCQPLYPGFPGSPLAPCRNAFIANNLDELVTALNAAINTSVATGEFSDQQSVTESVYEFGAFAAPPIDPFDPEDRYAGSIPILMQSTFELPGFMGHLKAFRRGDAGTPTDPLDDVSLEMWDAGDKLQNRLLNTTDGMGPVPASTCTTPGAGCYTFAQLYGNATNSNPLAVANSTAKIKRRIFTTTQNGVNSSYNPANLLGVSPLLAWTRVPLWPPTTGGASNTFVAPTATGTGASPVNGILDSAMGFDGLTKAELQALVPGACQGTVAADIHSDCTSGTAGVAVARTKREAREITLAYLAGAQVQAANGVPIRASSGGNADELLYVIRPWVMAESTLAAPGVVTPPLFPGPKTGGLGFEEYKHYRDGVRTLSTGAPVSTIPSQVVRGLGLRNPDRLADDATVAVKEAAAASLELKPSMSVIYHATNQALHAIRGGPCPTPDSSSGLSGTSVACENTLDGTPRESGGEELWAFVPFDQLAKLPALTKIQSRDNKQYLLAAPVRFTDVFVPGGASYGGISFNGVWRTLLYFGRGQGGKHMTALDVTAPGPFTRLSVETEAPIVVWSRGNPDTTTGVLGGPLVHNTFDRDRYAKMGETWSVPSVGYVTAADYGTLRKPSGTDFVLFMGSGYTDNPAPEGKTFFVIDALNGDMVRDFEIPNGSPAAPPVAIPPAPQDPPLTNFLVAPTVYYDENVDPLDPTRIESSSQFQFIGHPMTVKVRTVYFGDIHGRIWRYNAKTPAAAPAVFFQAPAGSDGNQPFATAVTVIAEPGVAGNVLVYAESGHDRRVTPQANKPFKSYAWRDVNGTRSDIFVQDFPADYRGTVQPAGGFISSTEPVVFYAGVRFTGACVSVFDSILYAFKALSTTGSPEAAFDLDGSTGEDPFMLIAGNKVNAIRVSSEGTLVIDQGLNAQNPPPAPGPGLPSVPISTTSATVTMGLVPGTKAFRELSATTVPYRVGASVCRTEP